MLKHSVRTDAGPAQTRFQTRAGYWPSRTGIFWWEQFRAQEVLRDFDAAAQLGFTSLVVSLVWSDFQPDMERVSVPAMRSLERVLDAAADRGMDLSLTLFPARIARLILLPAWALDITAERGPGVLVGQTFTRRPVRNLLQDERMLEGQLRQVREVIGAFSDHPAVSEWILGDRVALVSRPESSIDFETWLGTLVEMARAAGARQRLSHGLSAFDLVHSSEVNPGSIGSLGAAIRVADDWRPSWARDASAWWPAFLAGYATRLSGRPATVFDLGGSELRQVNPLQEAAREQLQQVDHVENTLSLVRQVGGGGCEAPFLLDFNPELRRSPQFQEEPWVLRAGLLRSDLKPKGVAEPWSRFARQQYESLPVPEQFPDPDPDLRSRQPEEVARECFEAFTR